MEKLFSSNFEVVCSWMQYCCFVSKFTSQSWNSASLRDENSVYLIGRNFVGKKWRKNHWLTNFFADEYFLPTNIFCRRNFPPTNTFCRRIFFTRWFWITLFIFFLKLNASFDATFRFYALFYKRKTLQKLKMMNLNWMNECEFCNFLVS